MHIPSLKHTVSAEEWQLRVDLAAAYRLVAAYGMSDLVFTHISSRVPDASDAFLINPYGMLFDEITASSLVKIDLAGNKLDDKNYHRFTGHIGNLKTTSLKDMLATHPERVIEIAVKGMLPKNPLGRAMYRKLKVYAGPNHPHAAQQPQALDI